MKCYRLNCKKQCDKYEVATCIYRLTKKQYNLIAKIKKYEPCKKCGKQTIKANYLGMEINLCTKCGVRNLLAINKNIRECEYNRENPSYKLF